MNIRHVNFKDEKKITGFGQQVRKFRLKQGISQSQLAFECEVELSQIARIENGKINTSIKMVFRIAEVLNLKPHQLFDFEW